MNEDLRHIVECLLFAAEKPLTLDTLRQVLSEADTRAIRAALQALTVEYERRGGGFFLREVAGGFQLRTRPAYAEYIRRLRQSTPPRLSRPALETLAIIAYHQPLIRTEIERLRGVDCGGVLRVLLERRIVRVIGRKEIPGRPLIYATTRHFLEMFDLKDLKDLPSPKEIEAMVAADRGETLPETPPPHGFQPDLPFPEPSAAPASEPEPESVAQSESESNPPPASAADPAATEPPKNS